MGEDEIVKGMHAKLMEWSREYDCEFIKKIEVIQRTRVQYRKLRGKD